MKPIFLTLFCALVLNDIGYASDIVDIQDGPTLAAHLRRLTPVEETRFQGTLSIIRRKEGELLVPFTSWTRLKPDGWEIIYETLPTEAQRKEKLTVVHSTSQPNVYFYSDSTAGKAGQAQQLDGAQACVPFANSDFYLADLGLDFFHWPTQQLEPPQMRKGRPCKVLESSPAPNSPCPYGKIKSWVDNETGGVIMAEAYDKSGNRIKEFEIKSFAKVNGQWQLQEMKIQDLKARSRTLLRFNLDP